VGQAIQGVLRRPGDFCARYGGEEFVAVLPDVDGEGAMFVAERIRCAVEALAIPHAEGASAKVVTLSLGVAVSEASQRTCQELVHQADVALYMAKRNGRNRAERFSVDVPGVAEHADSCCAGTA
jgi:diguanylate cyclase (GGDEF)-like protein